jgi:hypothetical protein
MTCRFICFAKSIQFTYCISLLYAVPVALLAEKADAGNYAGKMPNNSGFISVSCGNSGGLATGTTAYTPIFKMKNVQRTVTRAADRFVPDVSPQTYTESNKRAFASIRSTRPPQEEYRINGTIMSFGTTAKGELAVGTNTFGVRIPCDPKPKLDNIAQPGGPTYTPVGDPGNPYTPIICPSGTYPWGPNGECITSGPSALLYSSPDNVVASSPEQILSHLPAQPQFDQSLDLPTWQGIKWQADEIDS